MSQLLFKSPHMRYNHPKPNHPPSDRMPMISSKDSNSSPLLTRLEREYLFAQQQKTSRDHPSNQHQDRERGKENFHSMINSVPHTRSHHEPAPIVKIDNYEGRRFKTQQGYSPMMTKSRYDLPDNDEAPQETNGMHQSLEEVVMRK